MNKKKNAQSQQNTPEKANQQDSTPYDMHYTVNIKKGILSKDLNNSQEQIGGDSVETEKLSSNSSLTQPDNNFDITVEQSFNNISKTAELLSPQSLQNIEKKFNNTKLTPSKVPVISKFQLNQDTFDLDWMEDLYKPKKPKLSQTAKKSNQNYIKQNIQTVKEIKIKKQPFSTSVKKQNNSKIDQELDKVDLSILTKKNEINNQFQQSKVEDYILSPQITIENKKSRRSFEQFIREQHKFVCEKEEKLNHKRAQYQEIEEKAIREQVKANNIKGTLKQQKQIVDRLYRASFLEKVQTQQQNPKKKREIKNYYLESDFSYNKSYHYEELNKQQNQQIEITKSQKEKSKHSDEYFLKKLQASLKQWFNQNKLIDKDSFTEFLVKHHFIKEQEEKNLSIEIFQAIQRDNQVPSQGALPFLATVLGIYGKITSEKNYNEFVVGKVQASNIYKDFQIFRENWINQIQKKRSLRLQLKTQEYENQYTFKPFITEKSRKLGIFKKRKEIESQNQEQEELKQKSQIIIQNYKQQIKQKVSSNNLQQPSKSQLIENQSKNQQSMLTTSKKNQDNTAQYVSINLKIDDKTIQLKFKQQENPQLVVQELSQMYNLSNNSKMKLLEFLEKYLKIQ